MKINEFKKLEEKINGQNFNQGYKNINVVMLLLSIFGHFASIFLAYFALSKVLGGVIENNPVAVFIASIVMLSGLELLKRDIFDKFSIQYLKVKAFTKDVLPLFILSLAIIGTSFYASINGAKEFSSKEAVIEQNQKVVVNQFADSLTTVYNVKVAEVEKVQSDIINRGLLYQLLQTQKVGDANKLINISNSDLIQNLFEFIFIFVIVLAF